RNDCDDHWRVAGDALGTFLPTVAALSAWRRRRRVSLVSRAGYRCGALCFPPFVMRLHHVIPALAFLLLLAEPTIAQPQSDTPTDDQPNVEEQKEKKHHSSRRHRSRDIVAIADDVTLGSDDSANDVVVILGNSQIEGKVEGDVVCILGQVTLGSNAVLAKDITIVGGSLIAAPTAQILGDQTVVPGGLVRFPFPVGWSRDWLGHGLLLGRPLPHQYVWTWVVAGVFLLIYVLLAVLFPRPIQASVDALQTKPGSSLFTGFLTLLLIVPLIIVLIMTVVGILAVPFVVCGFIGAFIFGKVAVYRYAGEQIGHQLGASVLEKPLLALVVGVLLFYLLYTIPLVGLIVWATVVPLGIGAAVLALFKSYRSTTPRPPPTVPIPPVAFAGSLAPPVTAEAAMGAVRVGFWPRVVASALDFIIVAIITGLLFRRHAPALFIPIWAVYHIAM